jgi:hypothetical protein
LLADSYQKCGFINNGLQLAIWVSRYPHGTDEVGDGIYGSSMEVTYERNFDARVVYCVDHLFVKTEG